MENREHVPGTAERLFDYLGDVLYNLDHAELDLDQLDEGYRKLGEGLVFFARQLGELQRFIHALTRGELNTDLPSRDNELAAPLKSLHASLKHMTWQSKQVAKGDYRQRVEFMGEFADAFNLMVEQLDQRRTALLAEIESGRRKTLALEQSIQLLENVTAHLPQYLIVLATDTGERLYANAAANAAADTAGQLFSLLAEAARGEAFPDNELVLENGGVKRYFSVDSYRIGWRGHNAVAYVLNDISSERERLLQLEQRANNDALTGLSSRYHCMNILREWVEEKRRFCLCMVDLDNLKYVNDTYGHQEGDCYIIDAAACLVSYGGGAQAGRIGGDEFVLLIPDLDRSAVHDRMEVLRTELVNWRSADDRPYMRSFSYGAVGSDEMGELNASDLLSVADERMYDFKRRHKTERQQLTSAAGGA